MHIRRTYACHMHLRGKCYEICIWLHGWLMSTIRALPESWNYLKLMEYMVAGCEPLRSSVNSCPLLVSNTLTKVPCKKGNGKWTGYAIREHSMGQGISLNCTSRWHGHLLGVTIFSFCRQTIVIQYALRSISLLAWGRDIMKKQKYLITTPSGVTRRL